MDEMENRLARLPGALLPWYRENRRVLPWREEVSAYRTWVSEIMLQQTRVAAVIPYFQRFMAAYPTVEDLAACDEGELMRLWAGGFSAGRKGGFCGVPQCQCAWVRNAWQSAAVPSSCIKDGGIGGEKRRKI